jgi:hypothetical protein
MTCSGCNTVSYCVKDCQKADWLAWHWAECKRFPVVTVGEGRYAGEPLVFVPYAPAGVVVRRVGEVAL